METLIKLVYTGIIILHKENMNIATLIAETSGSRTVIRNTAKWTCDTDEMVTRKLKEITED